jgi:hypothetical protein
MKNHYASLLALLLITISFGVFSQETRIVQVDGWDPASGTNPAEYENTLYFTIMADSVERATNPNVIFELQRNHIYFLGKQIENYDFKLHIRGAEGEGLLPEIQASAKADGTFGLDYIRSYYDMTLENVAINGYLPDGGNQHWVIELRGTGSKYEFKNCTFDGDRAAAICARADSLNIQIRNCSAGNMGYRTAFGGNGRFIDLRPEAMYLDTLIIENSTTYNLSDRIIRNMNTHVNYLYIDHLTAANVLGRHGGIQLGDAKNATVKNSVFANVIMLGHTDAHTSEQTQPENPPKFSVITLDTIYDDGNYVIENNNIYWDETVLSLWDQIDTVSQPDFVNALLIEAVGAENADNMYFSEPLSFEEMCGPQISYVALYYADPNAGTYPDSWCVGGDGGLFPDQIDLSYATSSQSYTAGEGGVPVGNLNYFPGVQTNADQLVLPDVSVNAYPNPFTQKVNINYHVQEKGLVNITIYDVSGRMLKELINTDQPAGDYNITWNGTNDNGVKINDRVLIYRIETPSYTNSGKLLRVH